MVMVAVMCTLEFADCCAAAAAAAAVVEVCMFANPSFYTTNVGHYVYARARTMTYPEQQMPESQATQSLPSLSSSSSAPR